MSKQIVIRTVAAVSLAHAASEVARSQGIVLRVPVRTVSWRRTVQPAIAAGQPWRRADIAASATAATGPSGAIVDPTPTSVTAPVVTLTPTRPLIAARSIARPAVGPNDAPAQVVTVPAAPVPTAPVGALVLPTLGDSREPAPRRGGWRTRRLVAGAVVPVAAAGLLLAAFGQPVNHLGTRAEAVSAGVASSSSDAPVFVDPLARPAVPTPALAATTAPSTVPPAPPTTVVTIPAPAPPPAPPAIATAARPTGYDEVLHCIRQIESTQNYAAVSPSGKYRGAYQFDQPTWNGNAPAEWVGHDPASVPPAGQDQAAITLIQRRGLQPWPTPNRRCGHLLPG